MWDFSNQIMQVPVLTTVAHSGVARIAKIRATLFAIPQFTLQAAGRLSDNAKADGRWKMEDDTMMSRRPVATSLNG